MHQMHLFLAHQNLFTQKNLQSKTMAIISLSLQGSEYFFV
jgi:hypothetical protein